jgi:outer membrane receptor for monomeric catechols
LVGNEWSLGARYRISQSVLNDNFVDVPKGLPAVAFGNFQPRQRLEGVLHQLSLFTIYNHPSGFFAEGESLWYSQNNEGYQLNEPGDTFWQFDLFAGYRSPRRKAEVMIGLLNITDTNYRLSPLNLYDELPRERTFLLRLRLNF